MDAIKKLKLFQNFEIFSAGFGVKQIIDTLSFLFLLTDIVLNFNEKVLE